MTCTINQELLIDKIVKEKIRDLQQLIHVKKGLLSEQQRESAIQELEGYQELLYQNRLNHQIETR